MSPSAQLQLLTQQTRLLFCSIFYRAKSRRGLELLRSRPSGLAMETHFHASLTSNTLPQLFASLGVRGVIDENLCQIGIGILYLG
jgi:hypothetical protein